MACGLREEPYHPNSNLIVLLFLTELRIWFNLSPKGAKEAIRHTDYNNFPNND